MQYRIYGEIGIHGAADYPDARRGASSWIFIHPSSSTPSSTQRILPDPTFFYRFVSTFTLASREKSSLMIFDRHANLKYKYGRRVFWAKGYYVNTVGGNEAKIRKYIQEQEMQDQMSDQLSFREYEDPCKNIADLDDDSPEIPTDSRRKK